MAANRCGEERALLARANRSSERDQPPLGELLGKGAWSSTHRGSAAAVRVVGEARPKLIACEPLHARRTRGTDDELRGGVDLLGSRRCGAGARQGRAGIVAHRSSPETQLRRGDVERRPRSRALVNASGLLALRGQVPSSQSHLVGWFFRVIEAGDGRWVCRRGRTELDGHAQLQDAIEHLRTLAGHEVHAELFVHHQDGSVERLHSTYGRRLAGGPQLPR